MYTCKILEATKSLHATNKTQHNPISKYFKKILEENTSYCVCCVCVCVCVCACVCVYGEFGWFLKYMSSFSKICMSL